MAKHARRKGHPQPSSKPRPVRDEPPEVVAVRTLGPELHDWAFGPRTDAAAARSLTLAARIGPVLLDPQGQPDQRALALALADLVGALDGDRDSLRTVPAVLDALPADRALRFLRGLVAAETGESVKLQRDDALAGALVSLVRRREADTIADVVATRLEECRALAADVYGTVLGASLLAAARTTETIDAMARAVLDDRERPALFADDAVFSLVNRTLDHDHPTGDALTLREAVAQLRWAEWCDGVSKHALLPQSFAPERWHGAEMRKLAGGLVHSVLTGMIREQRYDEAERLVDDPPAPIDSREGDLARILIAIRAPGAVALAVPAPAERAALATAIEPHADAILALHEPECKRLDRPGAPYNEYVFEQTALLLGIHALCTGDWARAYDLADEFAWARHDRDVPIGVMYMLALTAAREADTIPLPHPAETLDDVADTPPARAFGIAADLLSALDHDYEPDLDELAALVDRLGGDRPADREPRPDTWGARVAALLAHLERLRAQAERRVASLPATVALADAAADDDAKDDDDEPEPWSDSRATRTLDAVGAGEPVDTATLEGLADHLAAAPDPDGRALDMRWLDAVEGDERVRHALGEDAADLERVRVLARLDRLDAARAVATGLFWRSVNGTAGPAYSAPDLADLVEELGAPAIELEPLQAALARHGDAAGRVDDESTEPVRVLFVGGNEIQAQYHAEIERSLPSRVTVDWFTTGWSARWGPEAERIESHYERADAVVLMQFTRTQLGRRLRRSSGEAGLPWIPCTGHGRDSLRRAIVRAVAVVDERRHAPSDQTAGHERSRP